MSSEGLIAEPSLGPLFEPTAAEMAATLAETYTQYCLLPADAPIEDYRHLYDAILELEARLDPVTITDTLTQAATAFHRDTGHCPFCREPGPLHLSSVTSPNDGDTPPADPINGEQQITPIVDTRVA